MNLLGKLKTAVAFVSKRHPSCKKGQIQLTLGKVHTSFYQNEGNAKANAGNLATIFGLQSHVIWFHVRGCLSMSPGPTCWSSNIIKKAHWVWDCCNGNHRSTRREWGNRILVAMRPSCQLSAEAYREAQRSGDCGFGTIGCSQSRQCLHCYWSDLWVFLHDCMTGTIAAVHDTTMSLTLGMNPQNACQKFRIWQFKSKVALKLKAKSDVQSCNTKTCH